MRRACNSLHLSVELLEPLYGQSWPPGFAILAVLREFLTVSGLCLAIHMEADMVCNHRGQRVQLQSGQGDLAKFMTVATCSTYRTYSQGSPAQFCECSPMFGCCMQCLVCPAEKHFYTICIQLLTQGALLMRCLLCLALMPYLVLYM